ncbi:hypothetical protein V8D89_012147, partial [Ganoderma adspersum]
MQDFFDIYNATPLGKAKLINPCTFLLKLCGQMTDYAADKKKLFRIMEECATSMKRGVREEKGMAAALLPEFLLALAEETKVAAKQADGVSAWQQFFPEALAVQNISIQAADTSVLVAYLDLFLELLDVVVNRKDGGEATNLERNVRVGLTDDPTLAELCVMPLHSQAVSLACDYIQRLIDTLDLFLSPDPSHESPVFDGQLWDNPDAFTRVHRLLSKLPYLRDIVVEFLKGTLETWKHFSAECALGGTMIARLT